jgi:fibronectin type 3 domain-containing protein
VTVSPVSGALAANSTASVIVTINSAAASLAPGNYTDTVTFANSTGKSTTRSVTLAVNAAVLNPPTNLKATVVNSKQTRSVKLTWQDNANVETKFEIWRATGSGTFALLGQAAANATSYTDATAARGATYSYEVRACNATDCSGDSNIATVKVK